MNDARNEIGSNWGSSTPRTLRDAFPHASIGGEWHASLEDQRQERIDAALTLAILVLVFLAGCVIGPFIMADPSVLWCWK